MSVTDITRSASLSLYDIDFYLVKENCEVYGKCHISKWSAAQIAHSQECHKFKKPNACCFKTHMPNIRMHFYIKLYGPEK